MGLKEGEVIQHRMITNSIERAQRKVEENNFGTRKRLIEYDDVMNAQREVIYKRRRHALYGERLQIDISNMINDVADQIAAAKDEGDFDQYRLELIRVFGIDSPVSLDEFNSLRAEALIEKTADAALQHYQEKGERMAAMSFPIIKNVYETQSGTYENIVTPVSDGIKTLQVVANLKRAYESGGRALILNMEKGTILAMIDDAWKEHLREMDDLKTNVQNAVYEQKDPLLIYKFESFELFKRMVSETNREIISFLMKAQLPSGGNMEEAAIQEERRKAQQAQPKLQTTREEVSAPQQQQGPPQAAQEPRKVETVVRQDPKIGRNDPCPCGSGKKYKNCHGQ
jgi:preprotein translocase subunit SecA